MSETAHGLTEVKWLVGLAAMLLVLMLLSWYTAIYAGTVLGATGFTGLQFGRYLLGGAAVTLGGGAWFIWRRPDAGPGLSEAISDLGHLAVSLGATCSLYLLVRLASPPRYYRITSNLDSSPFADDSSVQADVSVHAPAVLALLVVIGWLFVGARLAAGGPGGFSVERCFTVFRDARALTRDRR